MAEESYSKYEIAQMVGVRAKQISMGAPIKIKLTKKQLEEVSYNPIEIAKLEFEAGVIPLRIVREMPLPPTLEE